MKKMEENCASLGVWKPGWCHITIVNVVLQIRICNMEVMTTSSVSTLKCMHPRQQWEPWVSAKQQNRGGKGLFTCMPPSIHNEESILFFLIYLSLENRSHFRQGAKRQREREKWGKGAWAGAQERLYPIYLRHTFQQVMASSWLSPIHRSRSPQMTWLTEAVLCLQWLPSIIKDRQALTHSSVFSDHVETQTEELCVYNQHKQMSRSAKICLF